MEHQTISVARSGALARITLCRPERRNALSQKCLDELTDAFAAAGKDPALRAVILAAEGKVFSAGHDLSEMIGRDDAVYRELFERCTRLMETMQGIPQPVIAQVQGLATAAGCQLVASCDLAVASADARFATPGVRIGLFCTTPMVALTRAVSGKRAMEMLLTGEPISAAEALAAGLVNRVVPPGELAQATAALAEKIALSSAEVVALGKQAFYRQLQMPQPLAYDYAQDVMARNAAIPDAQEGMQAFLQKRAPAWGKR